MFGLVFCLESRSYVVQENTTDDAAAPHMRAMDAKSRFQAKASDARCNTANP